MPYLFQQILPDNQTQEKTYRVIYKTIDYFKLDEENISYFKTNLRSGFIGKGLVLIMKNIKTDEMFMFLDRRESDFYNVNVGECFWVLENHSLPDNKLITFKSQYKHFRQVCFTQNEIEWAVGQDKIEDFYKWFEGKTGMIQYNPETEKMETGFYKSDVEWFLKNKK